MGREIEARLAGLHAQCGGLETECSCPASNSLYQALLRTLCKMPVVRMACPPQVAQRGLALKNNPIQMYSFIFSFIHSFIPESLNEHLSCAVNNAEYWIIDTCLTFLPGQEGGPEIPPRLGC